MATLKRIIRDNIDELAAFVRKFNQEKNMEMFIYTMSKCIALEWLEEKIEKNNINDEEIPEIIDMELYIYNRVAETTGNEDISMITWILGMIKALEEIKQQIANLPTSPLG